MPKPPRIYVDTCVYLDLLTKNAEPHQDTGEPRWVSAKALFDAVNDDRVVLGASALIEAEVLCVPAVREGAQGTMDHIRGWFTAEATAWTDVDRFLAREAARLAGAWHVKRANPRKRLGGADAVHLAAAVRLGCDYLMTNDGGFPIGHEVQGVRVLRPTIVWPEHLLDSIET
jgi:predicted nucleic acid-binding protein